MERINNELKGIKDNGLWKNERYSLIDLLTHSLTHSSMRLQPHRVISSSQASEIMVKNKKVLNFCANNYLGLSNDPRLLEAAHKVAHSLLLTHSLTCSYSLILI